MRTLSLALQELSHIAYPVVSTGAKRSGETFFQRQAACRRKRSLRAALRALVETTDRPYAIALGTTEGSVGRIHLDAGPSENLRLLAVADLETGIVGEHDEVQAGQAGAAKVGVRQLRALPVDAIEIAADQRGAAEIGIDEGRCRT